MSATESLPPDFEGIDESMVLALARMAHLSLRPDELPAIVEQLRRACSIASPLLVCDLDEEDESGPIWRP